jgi:predicted RNA-binding Zn-ribbon protein involved in translation (DUF1610 family)
MEEEVDQRWQALSEEILRDVKGWRKAHPKATFREIEHEVHTRITRLEAQLLQDTAQASASREWSGKEEEERPPCPVCGTALHARGKQSRHLQGAGGQEVVLTRSYGTCPTCGVGLFPPR